MVVVDALHRDSVAAAADELFGGGTGYADLQAFFGHTAPEVKASGCGSDGDEELEWLSNKDAFPTVETMDWAGARPRTKGVRQSRAAVARGAAECRQCRHCGTRSTPRWREGPTGRRTLCNACGIMYRAGRLLPEYRPAKSPTFSSESELYSNRHHRVVQLRRLRGEAVQTSLAASGFGKKGGQEVERPSSKSVFLAVDTMPPAGQRPRTKGLQRPRRVLAWSPPPPPPPPPRTPAQGRVPGGGADGGCAAAPAGGGVEATAPRALPVAGPRRSQGRRDGMAGEQRCVAGAGDRGVGGDAAADEGRAVGQPGGGEMALDQGQGLRVPFFGSSCTAGGGAAAAPVRFRIKNLTGGGVDHAARTGAAALPTPAWAVAQRWCQHCGTVTTPKWREGIDGNRTLCNACGLCYKKRGVLLPEYRPAARSPTFSPTLHSSQSQHSCQHCGTVTTPQWREGPDGKRTLCNACGLWYRKSGVLVPEYRPASSPTFSKTLHSSHRSVVQLLRATAVGTTAIAAVNAGDK